MPRPPASLAIHAGAPAGVRGILGVLSLARKHGPAVAEEAA